MLRIGSSIIIIISFRHTFVPYCSVIIVINSVEGINCFTIVTKSLEL